MSLSQDFLTEAKKKLQVLDQKDTDRKRTAELKNNLEGYIYSTKEKVRRKQCAYSFHGVYILHLLFMGNLYPLKISNFLSGIHTKGCHLNS